MILSATFLFPKQRTLLLSIFAITLFLFNTTPLIANAASPLLDEVGLQSDVARQNAGYSNPDESSVQSAIGRFVNALTSLLGIILVVLIIYAGALWLMSGGNDTQIEKAKHILRNSMIGLAILLSAYAITQFVVRALVSTTTVPNYRDPGAMLRGGTKDTWNFLKDQNKDALTD